MKILPAYAAVLALFFMFLSVRTIRARRAAQVAVGDGGNAQLLRAMRVHANFAEYVPMALILIAMLEMRGGAPWLLHSLGLLLMAARVSHAVGVSQVQENFGHRVRGMLGTFAVIAVASVSLLISVAATGF